MNRPFRRTLVMVTILVMAWCTNQRTDHFHPIVAQARLATFAKPDLRGWPEYLLLGLVLLLGCIILAPFLDTKHRNRRNP